MRIYSRARVCLRVRVYVGLFPSTARALECMDRGTDSSSCMNRSLRDVLSRVEWRRSRPDQIYPGMFGCLLSPLVEKIRIKECQKKSRRFRSINGFIVCKVRKAAISYGKILPCKYEH